MSGAFGAAYAAAYDALYAAKDYPGEARWLADVFETFSTEPVRRVLDLGCGTGSHAIALAELGYRVTGVDRSPAMLAIAASRPGAATLPVTWACRDIRDLHVDGRFDAAVMMFNVAGYLADESDLHAALAGVRRALRPGGLLVFDAWFGPAVLKQRPAPKTRRFRTGSQELVRTATPALDLLAQTCTVHYRIAHNASSAASLSHEEHRIRFFFPGELRLLLVGAGLELVRLGQWPSLECDPDEESWSITVVARLPLNQGGGESAN
jgi:SAM-dependent methyltransferase